MENENVTKEGIVYEKQKVFSIYDAKAEMYSRPMFSQTVGQMTRSFQDLSNDKTHPIGQHPEDYFLYEIGTWDDRKAILVTLEKPVSLGKALDYAKKE